MGANTQQLLTAFGPLVILIIVFYFMLIRPQKKRDAEVKAMRESLKTGDEVLTIGGIKGKIVQVKEDYVIIETSGEKSKMEIMKWGINTVVADKKDLKAE